VCVWADGTGELFDAGGRSSGVMVMNWSIIIIIPLHIMALVGCLCVLAYVGVIIIITNIIHLSIQN
jgi:hypothetical protein